MRRLLEKLFAKAFRAFI